MRFANVSTAASAALYSGESIPFLSAILLASLSSNSSLARAAATVSNDTPLLGSASKAEPLAF